MECIWSSLFPSPSRIVLVGCVYTPLIDPSSTPSLTARSITSHKFKSKKSQTALRVREREKVRKKSKKKRTRAKVRKKNRDSLLFYGFFFFTYLYIRVCCMYVCMCVRKIVNYCNALEIVIHHGDWVTLSLTRIIYRSFFLFLSSLCLAEIPHHRAFYLSSPSLQL